MSQLNPLLSLKRQNTAVPLPAAEAFFQNIAARLRSRMVNRSATDIPIRTSGAEVRMLGEVMDDDIYAKNGIHGSIWVGSARMPGLILMQHDLLSRLIAVLLGQSIGELGVPTQFRSLTPVEKRIATRLCTELLEETSACWPERPAPRLQFGGLSVSAQALEPSLSTVPVYSVTMEFGPEDATLGLLTLSLPVLSLNSLSSTIQADPDSSNRKSKAASGLESVMPVEVELSAELTQLQLTVNQLRDLAVGNVLDLGSMRDVVVRVNGLPMFEGQAGTSMGMRSVKILRRYRG